MNISNFLQMLGGNMSPTPGPAPQLPQQDNVPRGTSGGPTGGFNVLEKGADAAINTARKTLGTTSQSFARPYVQLFSDAIRGSMLTSEHPGMQAMGKAEFNPYAQQDAQLAENMKVAEYLHKAEEARRTHEMKEREMKEYERHNKASEKISGSKDGMGGSDEFGVNENGDPVQPMGRMKPALKKWALTEVKGYTHKATEAVKSLEVAERMKFLAKKHPKIMNSWGFVIHNMHNNDPGFWQQAALNAGLDQKEKEVLSEMASLAKHFNLHSMEILGSRANMMVDKVLFAANPSAKMPPKVLVTTLDRVIPEFKHAHTEYKKGSNYGRRGSFYMPSSYELEQEARDMSEPEDKAAKQGAVKWSDVTPEKQQGLSELSEEEINALLGE